MKGIRIYLGLIAAVAGAATMISVVSASSNNNSTAKAELASRHASERAAAVAGPRAPKDGAGPRVAVGRSVRQQGILNVRQGPVPAGEFLVRNSWQGPAGSSGSTWYVVWAGASGSESAAPGTPGVIVHLQTPSADGTSFTDTVVGTFSDAGADGPLAIIGVHGTVVDLASTSGRIYHFDLQTRTFS